VAITDDLLELLMEPTPQKTNTIMISAKAIFTPHDWAFCRIESNMLRILWF
jgi:hypothetical protein